MEPCDPSVAEITEIVESCDGFPSDWWGPVAEEEIADAEQSLGIVFPRSYRAFLRCYGAGTVGYCKIFGLPGDHLWGNVVVMNQFATGHVPPHCVKFTERVGDYTYYLDTSRMDAARECPVAVYGDDEAATTVADSFLDFLRKVREGLV